MSIEINGVKYEQRPQSPKRMSKSLTLMMAMAAIVETGMGGGRKEPERPEVDIVEEFKLIQQKKSRLSRSQRDWVEYQFHKNFKEVIEPPVFPEDRFETPA